MCKSPPKAKDSVFQTKHQPIEWEKAFSNSVSDKGMIFKIYEEFKKLGIENQIIQFTNGIHT